MSYWTPDDGDCPNCGSTKIVIVRATGRHACFDCKWEEPMESVHAPGMVCEGCDQVADEDLVVEIRKTGECLCADCWEETERKAMEEVLGETAAKAGEFREELEAYIGDLCENYHVDPKEALERPHVAALLRMLKAMEKWFEAE